MLWIFILIIVVLLFLLFVTNKPEGEDSEEMPVYVCSECNETDCDCHLVKDQNGSEPGGDR
jgi:hypothetical protein